jgi:hypothetical protein
VGAIRAAADVDEKGKGEREKGQRLGLGSGGARVRTCEVSSSFLHYQDLPMTVNRGLLTI